MKPGAVAMLCMGLLAMSAAAPGSDIPEIWDGLVRVKSTQLEAVYLLPGADFRPYDAVLAESSRASFSKRWLTDVNEPMRASGGGISEEDATEILLAMQSNFDEIFAETLRKAGFSVVQGPTPGALQVSTAVIDLYVNAPEGKSVAIERIFVVQAGRATLVMEVRDSMTGALMARVVDRRATRTAAKQASSASDLADFRRLFQDWARSSTAWLDKLKTRSPLPTDLRPQQQL